jgi:cyanophycin synthetase
MLNILNTRILRGPNVWARIPVVHMEVEFDGPTGHSTRSMPNVIERILCDLPTLRDHGCSSRRPGGFVEELHSGTSMAHVLEHVALAIQSQAGIHVTRGMTRPAGASGIYNVVYAYRQEDVGRASGELAARYLNSLLDGSAGEFNPVREIEEGITRLAERLAFGPSTLDIVSEAEHRNIPVLRLHPNSSLVQLGHGRYQRRIWATRTSVTSGVATDIAGNKDLTNRLLRDMGIPSPAGMVVRTANEAARAANRLGYPVALKPMDGNHGRGVCLDLENATQVKRRFPNAKSESRDGSVLVERMVTGKDYRVLVVEGEAIAVAERVPAQVIGDGVQTVRQLVDITNADPRRGVGHENVLTRIVLDDQTDHLLAPQGLSLDNVAEAGRVVRLKQTANMSTGGTSIDRTDDIHPDNVEIAVEAALAIGLDVAGIDFITPDISRSVHEVGGAIVEVNAAPGFRMHTHPTEGLPRQVGRAVVDALFPPSAPTRVPIVAVTGTNGKTTTTRMIAHIMAGAGHTVGMTTTDGIYVNGTQIAAGDMAGPESARMVLRNPRVDMAVLETARGGILRSGLGFDRCNVAVVTNVASDHLGLKGVDTLEDLARVKAVVPRSVLPEGTSVLNAENPWTVKMANVARGEIIYFSMNEDNPVIQEHVRHNGRAVVLRQTPRGGMITLLDSRRETHILAARDIPATLDERLQVNTANALAATAAAVGANVSIATIRATLRTFSTAYWQTPGRFNLLSVEGRQVVVDYCHNVDGLRWLADFVERTPAPRSVGVIAIAGDRRDEDIREFGELAGRTFDHLVIREDDDLRGREPGEVAALLLEAVTAAGVPPERTTMIMDEVEATHAAIDLADPGDLVVAMVYRIPRVWEDLVRRQERTVSAATPLSVISVPADALAAMQAPARS